MPAPNKAEQNFETRTLVIYERVESVNGANKRILRRNRGPDAEEENFDINELPTHLNQFLQNHLQAIKNWHLVKFRISIISTFGKLNSLKENVEELQPLPKKKPKYKRYWFIINHESRYKLLWDVLWSGMLISSFFITFFTLAFNNYPA